MKNRYYLFALFTIISINPSLVFGQKTYPTWNAGSSKVYYAAGNVGIGTTSPSQKLEIFNGNIRLSKTNPPQLGAFGWEFENENSGLNIKSFFNSTATSRLYIKRDGSIGIGTTNTKGYKLGVNGNIAATEVVVAQYNNWPDYVFKANYKLPTLHEVEKFIKENNHLPGVPSAKEISETGVKLGEMNKTLLKKIEELTLYVIELKKENIRIQKQIANLKAQ